jgi:hypothetical protein
MDDPILKTAEFDAAGLREKLSGNPDYRRLQILEKFIQDYRSIAPASRAPVAPLAGNIEKSKKYGRQGSVSATVIEASEAFLQSINRRAMSGEIYDAIKSKVSVPGKTPTSTLSSYLSTSDLFDNVKGKGYGLSVWKTYHP